jgi:5-methylcytosine-specific restriction endonuclease McrA
MPGIDVARARSLRAAGWTLKQIGAELGCAGETVRLRLDPAAAARAAETARKWSEAHGAAYQRRRYAANPEANRAYRRAWNKANPEKMREINRRNYERHKEARQEYDRQRNRRPEALAYARTRRLKSISQRFGASVSAASKRAVKTGIPFERVDLEALCERDGWTCQLCFGPVDRAIMARYHPYGMSFDHVVPETAGGGWTWGNLQLAHRGCNVMRGDLSVEEARRFAREILARLASHG